jgi:hypothetical protein
MLLVYRRPHLARRAKLKRMPFYIPTLAVLILALGATYGLWLISRARGARVLLVLAAIAALVATLVLRKLEP